jgi:hypothetical protein
MGMALVVCSYAFSATGRTKPVFYHFQNNKSNETSFFMSYISIDFFRVAGTTQHSAHHSK